MQKYYTYAYLREDRTPYYIGKGSGNRAYRRSKKRINPPKDKSRVIILKNFLIEEEAFKHEVYMIAVFGRIDLGTGILHNRTDGGEGVSGWVASEETRRKQSEAHKGRTHSQKSRKKIGDIHRGKVLSNKTKRKIGETRKERGYTCPEELKKHFSKLYTGEGNPNYGKKHSPQTLKKISEGTRGKNTKIRHFITPTGEQITITDLRKYCNENGLNQHCMINLHNGHGNYHKGYQKAPIASETQ